MDLKEETNEQSDICCEGLLSGEEQPLGWGCCLRQGGCLGCGGDSGVGGTQKMRGNEWWETLSQGEEEQPV